MKYLIPDISIMLGDDMSRRSKQDTSMVYFILLFTLLVVIKHYPWVLGLAVAIGILVLCIRVLSKIKSSKFKAYDMAYIDRMDDFKFEDYIRDLYKALGYTDSYTTPKSGDYGADVIAENSHEKLAIQVKHYAPKNKTGVKAIQEIIAAKSFYNASKCVVLTTSYFTANAKNMAQRCNVTLIDRDELKRMLISIKGF